MSYEFLLGVIAFVEVTYRSFACTGEATSYVPRFLFLFLILLHRKDLFYFKFSLDILLVLMLMPWCSGYHYCKPTFNKACTQVILYL